MGSKINKLLQNKSEVSLVQKNNFNKESIGIEIIKGFLMVAVTAVQGYTMLFVAITGSFDSNNKNKKAYWVKFCKVRSMCVSYKFLKT